MSNYRTTVRLTLILLAVLLVGAALGVMLERSALRDTYRTVREGDKLGWALTQIENRYVDPISRDSLAELAVPILLQRTCPPNASTP